MPIAFITMNRFMEERAASDADYRELLRKNGKITLATARALSDDQLLAKLTSLGIAVDRASFPDRIKPFVSAEEIARAICDQPDSQIASRDEDWVWVAFTCLWERWCPEQPSLEMIDDAMQEGYQAKKARDDVRACRLWLKTWQDIRAVMAVRGLHSVKEWDGQYSGTQSLFNWGQDFILALGNAGRDDRSFFEERRAVLETLLGLHLPDESYRNHVRRDLAETYFDLGMPEKGEQLFRQWLEEKPTWGWGWIGWSDCYVLFAYDREKDPARAEQILKQGLAVPGVEEREYLLERLQELYEKTGRVAEAQTLKDEIERLHKPAPVKPTPPARPVAPLRSPPILTRGLEQPLPTTRVGRNDPCPCGSGKKYKKCCMRG
jgi:hypothetical protein